MAKNVIITSHCQQTEVPMTQTPRRVGNLVYLFGDTTKDTPSPKAEPKVHILNLEEYLTLLHDHGYISTVEHDELYTAVAGLIERFPHITTVEAVREELAKSKNRKVRDLEASLWEEADLIDNFDVEAALQHFQTSRKDDPQASVRGITADIDQQIDSRQFVATHLEKGEVFFWIILRMCRLQHKLDVATRVEAPSEPTTPTERIADRFLAGNMSAQVAATEVKDQLPPTEAETTAELMNALNEFVGKADVLVEESKALHRRKSLVEKALTIVLNIILWRSKWRRSAIDTRLP